MKTNTLGFIVACLALWLGSCKEPTINEGILPLSEPATVDAGGGNWRTITLRSGADITVPQPAAITSDAYVGELTEVKNGLLGVNPERNTAINYWAAGGVHRWNQIARQLVAKYNVAPLYNEATGAFAPFDATNPFANPPYAARLYALLSVAQYDALVVAWRAKYQYNRPSLTRQGINGLVPVLDVPSYPSEDAAIAEASAQMLTFFFPKEADFIKAKAAEHKQSRIWAGANVASDLKAGEELAAAVTAKVLARARTDRFGAARDANSTWQTAIANAPYDVKWTSLEIPARPPMLPLGGNVKTWYDSTSVFRATPGPPPATTSPEFQKALAEVRTIADTRTREQWRIADFWADGAGTYTPPGHWNLIAEDLIRQDRQNELRAARTYALMNRAMQDGGTACWYTKYKYFVPRPSQMDPAIKTATGIPNFPSYTSGHATFSSAAATVLGHLFPSEAANLTAQAEEAALSRLLGGIHYRFDNEEGAKCGTAVGKIAVDWAKTDGAQ
ncbi:phosphatase PAP2 family protein [Spirosoma arcticum]